jgi:hypothetical protein
VPGSLPEVGHFEAELFDPKRWKPNYPNLTFEEMDESDAYAPRSSPLSPMK